MCGRFVTAREASIERYFSQIDTSWWGDFDNFDLRPTQAAPIITGHKGSFESHAMLWGLLPHWAKDKRIAYKTINARGETLAEKPSFREAYKYGRCIVPTAGFYEWSGEKGSKVRHFIKAADGEPVFMAGLAASNSQIDNQPLLSFTIVTTTANELMSQIHHRMPVILRGDDLEKWLCGTVHEADTLIGPCNDDWLTAYPVASNIGNDRMQAEPLG